MADKDPYGFVDDVQEQLVDWLIFRLTLACFGGEIAIVAGIALWP